MADLGPEWHLVYILWHHNLMFVQKISRVSWLKKIAKPEFIRGY